MRVTSFDEIHCLHELHHYLPTQTPLKDFIHHNSLHAFQSMKFFDALFTSSEIFGYQVTLELKDFRKLYQTGRIQDAVLTSILTQQKGAEDVETWKQKLLHQTYDEMIVPRIGQLRSQWRESHHIDLDQLVQPILFRFIAAYLDQGISQQTFPISPEGFWASMQNLNHHSFTSIFSSRRVRKLFQESSCSIPELLHILVGDSAYYEQYLFDQQFSHRGWSGMVATIEKRPETLLDTRKITLQEFIQFELLLEIDQLDTALGSQWKPLCTNYEKPALHLFDAFNTHEYQQVLTLWQLAFEWSYYDQVLIGLSKGFHQDTTERVRKSFQAIFCIDERECSLRRHIEAVDPLCETLGSPGFFGVEFYFQAYGANFLDKLCPAPVTPKYLIKEVDVKEEREHDILYARNVNRLLTGAAASVTLGFVSGWQMLLNMVRPKMSPAISNAFSLMHKHSRLIIEHAENAPNEFNLQVGFTIDEMANRVESLLRSIGLIHHFAPIVYVVAHGSSSANNPHHGAHDCGACSGRPGSVNARVFAFMANHHLVRQILAQREILIPADTVFIGALHDTAGDEIEYYDDEELRPMHLAAHDQNKISFEKALDRNAKERSRRFASISTQQPIASIRKAIKDRSVSLFEPRPELGHGTNTLCIVGRRQMTQHLFLDRRAFLNSYDYQQDPEGKLLVGVMKPLGPVCGGINLEYYFSRVDNHKLGAGTKLPHHVMGLVGVTNSVDGDLRPGLPLQMIEVHDPVRLLIVVEHFPEVVLRTIQSAADMYEWFINEWVHLVAMHPITKEFYYFHDGQFERYQVITQHLDHADNIFTHIENTPEMKTNYIVDATAENMPVLTLHEN
ncbi:MAG TPA: DUF2309 domain-containing protein [Chitinophagaceae bacterium]|nr:DUF2309 domain-containing protein [Chitinophagaceae bacterium]